MSSAPKKARKSSSDMMPCMLARGDREQPLPQPVGAAGHEANCATLPHTHVCTLTKTKLQEGAAAFSYSMLQQERVSNSVAGRAARGC